MRGKVRDENVDNAAVRITPAYAGKRPNCQGDQLKDEDHPRVCGEKWCRTCASGSCTGSPPRMRGKAFFCVECSAGRRITPAYAGKSHQIIRRARFRKDHPRVCGEKRLGFGFDSIRCGSPPRMRGKERHKDHYTVSEGITPAYAGKRRRLSSRPRPE